MFKDINGWISSIMKNNDKTKQKPIEQVVETPMAFNVELENEQNKSIQKANSKQIEFTVVCGL